MWHILITELSPPAWMRPGRLSWTWQPCIAALRPCLWMSCCLVLGPWSLHSQCFHINISIYISVLWHHYVYLYLCASPLPCLFISQCFPTTISIYISEKSQLMVHTANVHKIFLVYFTALVYMNTLSFIFNMFRSSQFVFLSVSHTLNISNFI